MSAQENEPAAGRDLVYIAVVGPGDGATSDERAAARKVGELLAARGAIVVCGGLNGVMAAASQGASEHGGLTVGLLPGSDRAAGNQHLSVVLPTGMGELRNGLVVRCSDAVIAVGGSWGTLSEIALAVRTGKPVVAIGGWTVAGPAHPPAGQPYNHAKTPEDAVDSALRLVSSQAGPS